MPDFAVIAMVGIVGGWLAGMLGVGGGVIFVPALVLLLDHDQHEAQGISLVVIAVTALAGTVVHRRQGNIDVPVAALVTPAAMVAGLVGGILATQLPEDALQRIFAIMLAALSIRMSVQAWRGSPARSEVRP
ncbi:MAG TPA: sulfite exporter TauE/SafE family protein [Dehalococcoidia bacterium]|nr:sulfite exporter TauE/SafE family protein [Dehalococcoidia bacterium]